MFLKQSNKLAHIQLKLVPQSIAVLSKNNGDREQTTAVYTMKPPYS